jgi:hypothetical protein
MNRLLLPDHLDYADTDFDIRLFYSIFAIHILNEGGDYEKVVLYVEGEPIAIDEEVFSVLDKYEKPKNIVFIPKFTVTATGKIVRKESIDSL